MHRSNRDNAIKWNCEIVTFPLLCIAWISYHGHTGTMVAAGTDRWMPAYFDTLQARFARAWQHEVIAA
ncbi:hypothetical protein WM40_02320 [Robbsia andropogonis]|uniref:Uncharacterized protein n=1 Tax=Robbsia andropogonis TaxID=28092 RepID=A0A0F5K4J3_9BURK|nr:hypothetical protein WM40_02320 [Robbsia andropogonis]